ncbi:MAG: hypothetical protein ACKOWQ_00395 [Aquirufa sp.]
MSKRIIASFFIGLSLLVAWQGRAQTSTYHFQILDGASGKFIHQAIITYEDTLGNFVKFTKIDSSISKDVVPNSTLKLSINAMDYHTYTELIHFPILETKYFFMKKDTAYQLSEVIVRPKNYNYLPDTVSLKVKDLRLPTDKKIEDLLRRFPGVKVDENGRIQYRNKPVETVLLDGDNLMESNYTMATKNINVDEIEEIEAYDHFSENSIVASLGSSQSVALNLKFAKKFSYTQSGEAHAAVVEDQLNGYSVQSNSIINTKYVKTFAMFSSNNVGDNQSTLNYNDYRDQSPVYENLPSFPLNYGGGFPNEGKLKLNRNKQFTANVNNIFKIHRKLTFKLFANNLNDDFANRNTNYSEIKLPGNSFITSDVYNFHTLPKKWGQSVNLKYQPSGKFIVEGKYYLNRGEIQYATNQTINSELGFDSKQKSYIKDYYLESLSTIKTGDNSAIQILTQNLSSQNEVDLRMNYQNPLNLSINQLLLQQYQENKWIGKWIKVWIPKLFIAETSFENLNLSQNLFRNQMVSSHFDEIRSTIRQEFKGNFYGLVYRMNVENARINVNNNNLTGTFQQFNWDAGISSKLFDQNFSIDYSRGLNPAYRNYYIKDTLFLDSRNQRIDSIQIGFPKAEKWNVNLSNYLLSKVHYMVSYSINNSDGNYFNNNFLSNLFSLQKNQWLKIQSSQKLLNAELSYYAKELAVTFKIKGSYSSFKFANLINDGTIRNNLSTNQSLTISAKSGYIKAFNFYEAFTVEKSNFENQFGSFQNALYGNEILLYFIKNRVNSFLQVNSYQFYSSGPFLHFLGAGFDLKSKNNLLTYSLKLENLLDVRERNFYIINDFSRSEMKNFLVGRTAMIGVHFSL